MENLKNIININSINKGFKFSYVCKFTNKVINEVVSHVTDKDKFIVCDSCSVYTMDELSIFLNKKVCYNMQYIDLKNRYALYIAGLYNYYTNALNVAFTPCLDKFDRYYYKKLNLLGYKFECGYLIKTN